MECRSNLTMSVAEAAKSLGLGKGLTYELIRRNELPAVRLGKKRLVIYVKALEELLERRSSEVRSRQPSS